MIIQLIRMLVLLAALPSGQTGAPAAAEPCRLMPRAEFAVAIKQVKERMSADEVRAILGPADDVRTPEDFAGTSYSDFKEMWTYGTDGHNTFPTLGRVWFGEVGKVNSLFGAEGQPPVEKLVDEVQLRSLLQLIDRAAGHGYHPLHTIKAVNALRRFGKDRGMAALREYVRVRTNLTRGDNLVREFGYVSLLRVLFEIPVNPGYMPRVWSREPKQPPDPTIAPRWPIVIVDDIPLLFADVSGFGLGAHPHASYPEPTLEEYAESCIWQSTPLVPPDRLLGFLDQLPRLSQWMYDKYDSEYLTNEYGRKFIARQMFNLLRTVYRPKIGDPNCDATMITMEQAIEGIDRLDIRWDTLTDQYTFIDGTTLPDETPVPYPRIYWKPELSRWDVTVSLMRIDDKKVEACIRWSGKAALFRPEFGVRFYSADDPSRGYGILGEQHLFPDDKGLPSAERHHLHTSSGFDHDSEGKPRMTGGTSIEMSLPAGQRVQADLKYFKKNRTSPVLVP